MVANYTKSNWPSFKPHTATVLAFLVWSVQYWYWEPTLASEVKFYPCEVSVIISNANSLSLLEMVKKKKRKALQGQASQEYYLYSPLFHIDVVPSHAELVVEEHDVMQFFFFETRTCVLFSPVLNVTEVLQSQRDGTGQEKEHQLDIYTKDTPPPFCFYSMP